MPEKTRLTLDQLRARAVQRIAKFKTAGRDDSAAAVEAVADLLKSLFKYRERLETAGTAPVDADAAQRLAQAREEVDELQGEVDRLTASVPAGDALVLTGDQRKQYDAFLALKLEPSAIAERLTLATSLEGEVGEARAGKLRDDAGAAMAAVVGKAWKPSVIGDILKLNGLTMELRDVTVKKRDTHGKETLETHVVKVPHVRPAAKADAPFQRFDEFVTAHAKDYVPVLPVDGGNGNGNGNGQGTGTGNGNTSGVRFPAQPGDDRAPSAGSAAKRHMGRTYVTPSQIASRVNSREL